MIDNNPFKYVESISYTKEDLRKHENFNKNYNAFLINRALSYYNDTIFIANEMNIQSYLPVDMQYTFLLNIIKPRKRFSKWFKKDKNEQIILIMKMFKESYRKSQEILEVLTEEQLEILKTYSEEGNDSGNNR